MSPNTVQDDLAFLRALTDGDVARGHQALFGRIYFGAGLIYGAQVAFSLVHNTGLFAVPGGDGALALVASGIFVPWMCWELWRSRGVGAGMLDAACPGQVFTSPTPDRLVAASAPVA